MALRERTGTCRTRLLVLVLSVFFVAFLTQGTVHVHTNGQHETTCQACQAAHLGSILPSGTLPPSLTPRVVAYVEPLVVADRAATLSHDCLSRAPPSSSLEARYPRQSLSAA